MWVESKISQSLKPLEITMNLILLKLPADGTYTSCTVEEPAETTLVDIGSCLLDTDHVMTSGSFKAPQDGVYKAVYNGSNICKSCLCNFL